MGQYKVVVSTRDTQGYHLSQLKVRFGFLRIWPKKDFKMVKVAFYCVALMAIGCQLALATDSSDSDNLPGELQPNLTPGMVEVQEGKGGHLTCERCCSKIERKAKKGKITYRCC